MFLLADYLQLDVSVAPASRFRPTSPRFKLLFGEANEPELTRLPTPADTLGWAVLFARHARICVEHEQRWQAEYSISQCPSMGWNSRACVMAFPRSTPRDSTDWTPRTVTRSRSDRAITGPQGVEARPAAGIRSLLRECESAATANADDSDSARWRAGLTEGLLTGVTLVGPTSREAAPVGNGIESA